MKVIRLLQATVLWLSLPLSGQAFAAPCPDRIDTSAAVLSNGFAYDTSNTRNAISPITSANVAGLQLALAHAGVGRDEKRGAPAVTTQAVFFSAARDLVAMNRVTGCTYWTFSIPPISQPLIGDNFVRSSSIYYLNEGGGKPALVLAGDFFGNFYALDARTGTQVWSRFLGTEPDHHFITGSPQFHGGKLIVPVATKEVLSTIVEPVEPCCTSHGMLRAINPYTGQILWTYHATANATLRLDTLHQGPNGVSLWGTPAIDAARNSIYLGTGQNLTRPTTNNSDAIVALDLSTGATKWIFQSTAGDAWNGGCNMATPLDLDCDKPAGGDYDFGAPPILARLPDGQDAIIAGAKNGVVYSLNPDTGAVNWSRKIGAGANLGGIHWGMAVDATRVYAAVSDVIVNKRTGLPITTLTDFGAATAAAMELAPNATPGVYALDLVTGAVVWERHPTHLYEGAAVPSIFSAAVSVTNDVVFAGSLDGVIRAFRSSDGAELWSYYTAYSFVDVNGNQGKGGTIDSVGAVVAGGDLLVNSGYNTFGGVNRFQVGPGNALFIFRLPGH